MADINGKTIMLIGSGPQIIGQSGQTDEGIVEACRSLTDQGCRVIVVNPNPDALATDPGLAHRTYIEPLTVETLAYIVNKEHPDVLLPSFGGREALHLAVQMEPPATTTAAPMLVWGTPVGNLKRVLDRDALKQAMQKINIATPAIHTAMDVETALEKAQELGFPVVLRCDDTNLISDGIMVYNLEELQQTASPIKAEPGAVLFVEASLWDYRQVEIELLRDITGKSRIAGAVEYLDCAGIHPGDAIGVTPPQTIAADLMGRLTDLSSTVADHLEIIGNATLRFAYHPANRDVLVTAVHPRYTRTSALISRAKGISLARIVTLLAAGSTWEQINTPIPLPTKGLAPVAVKWPCWDFKHLMSGDSRLGPRMQAVGQCFGLGANFKQALQNTVCAAMPIKGGLGKNPEKSPESVDQLILKAAMPTGKRLFILYQALALGADVDAVSQNAHIDPWFITQLKSLADLENRLKAGADALSDDDLLRQAKSDGFDNAYLARLLGVPYETLDDQLKTSAIVPTWSIPTTDGAWQGNGAFAVYGGDDAPPPTSGDPTVLILGSGPHEVGRGYECDHGIYYAAKAATAMGYTPVIINANLTSITTGPSMAARCYYLPLTREAVLSVVDREKPVGMITQFAGNAASGLLNALTATGVSLLGTSLDTMQLVRNRAAFRQHMLSMGIVQPSAALVSNKTDLERLTAEMGYPVVLRPAVGESVQPVQLVMDDAVRDTYLAAWPLSEQHPLSVEQFLEYAIEAQVDLLCDGNDTHVAAVMEHIELAGVHPGDSACVLPPYSLAPRHVETMTEYARKIAIGMGIKGLLNLRFAVYRDTVFLLNGVCGASRNLAMITRSAQIPVAELATRIILGAKLADLNIPRQNHSGFGVRAAVFPFNVFPDIDPLLGVRMLSTGHVLSLSDSFGMAYFKALEASATPLPTQGTVLITVTDEDKHAILEPARLFQDMGFQLMATRGTHAALTQHGIEAKLVRKLGFGRPDLSDEMKNGHVQMVINTPSGSQSQKDGSYIRTTAIRCRITNITTPASAIAAAKGIAARRKGRDEVHTLK